MTPAPQGTAAELSWGGRRLVLLPGPAAWVPALGRIAAVLDDGRPGWVRASKNGVTFVIAARPDGSFARELGTYFTACGLSANRLGSSTIPDAWRDWAFSAVQ